MHLSKVHSPMETWVRSLLTFPASRQGPHTTVTEFGKLYYSENIITQNKTFCSESRHSAKDPRTEQVLLQVRIKVQAADNKHFISLIYSWLNWDCLVITDQVCIAFRIRSRAYRTRCQVMLPSEIKSARSQVQGKEQLAQVLQPAGDKPKKGTHTSQPRTKVF